MSVTLRNKLTSATKKPVYTYSNENGESFYVVDNEVLKTGLDIILKEMHGEFSPTDNTQWCSKSLNQIIREVSPKDENGKNIYNSTDDFTSEFITEDKNSAEFCVDDLRYMDYYSQDGKTVNGSVLTSFDSTQGSLLKEENEVIENEEPVEIIEQQEEVLPAA